MRNLLGRGTELTRVVNGESIQLTRSSKSLDTRPLRAFIITYICSFIACISAIIGSGAVSTREGRLTFYRSGLLGALLAWGPSWFLLSVLVPSWSAPWLSGATFFWRSCSSRLLFCLVRRSTAVARVLTCLSRAVVGGSSSWTSLVVAIEQVSTMQLLSRKRQYDLHYKFPQTAPTNDAEKNHQ